MEHWQVRLRSAVGPWVELPTFPYCERTHHGEIQAAAQRVPVSILTEIWLTLSLHPRDRLPKWPFADYPTDTDTEDRESQNIEIMWVEVRFNNFRFLLAVIEY